MSCWFSIFFFFKENTHANEHPDLYICYCNGKVYNHIYSSITSTARPPWKKSKKHTHPFFLSLFSAVHPLKTWSCVYLSNFKYHFGGSEGTNIGLFWLKVMPLPKNNVHPDLTHWLTVLSFKLLLCVSHFIVILLIWIEVLY